MIRVDRVSKSFGGVHAVRDISFEVPKGQVVGLLGSNGAGKTTTIRIITGFLPPDQGRVLVDGLDTIDRTLDARARLGYLPESAPGYAEMAVADYLTFRARLYGVPRRKLRPAVDRALGLCELTDVRARRVGQLSKGYRQRVGLAASFVHDPPALVLDEPTNALDPRQIRHTRAIIRELGQDRAVLVSSHILAEVERTCDRVVVLARGQVRADADPAALLDRHAGDAPYTLECRPAPGHADPARACVAAIEHAPGVAAVHAEPLAEGFVRLRITPAPGAGDLRTLIASSAAQGGLAIRELTRPRPSLERVFMDLAETDAAGRAETAP